MEGCTLLTSLITSMLWTPEVLSAIIQSLTFARSGVRHNLLVHAHAVMAVKSSVKQDAS